LAVIEEITMSRHLPVPSKISQPFWDSCKAEAMQIQKCESCGTFAFYPVYICPECASRKLAWTRVSGKATIYTYTVAQKSVFEDVKGPMVVALVELEEGAMMTSNIVNADPAALAVGMPVRLCYEPISEDITLPVFEPAP
jgi:uncharacterized OB-fold protein